MISFHTTSFFGCSIDSFSVVSKENKIESVWAGEVQKRLIHLPVRGIQQAVPQRRHGWNLIQPGKRKKNHTKITAPIYMCPTETLWTDCSNNISLKSHSGVFGLPLSISPAHRNRPWLLGGPWKSWSAADATTLLGLGSGSHRRAVIPRSQPSRCKASSLGASSSHSTAGFWRLSVKKTSPHAVPPGYGVGWKGGFKVRKHWDQGICSPCNIFHHLSLIASWDKFNSLCRAEIVTWKKTSNIIGRHLYLLT